MDDQGRRTDEKLDRMDEKLDDQGVRLDEYNRQLEIHIAGVDALKKIQENLHSRIEPLEKAHNSKKVLDEYKMATWKKWVAGLGVVATIVGIVAGIVELL